MLSSIGAHRFERCTFEDLDLTCWLFEEAIDYQKRLSRPHYGEVDRPSHKKDIERGESFKLILEDQVAMTFSLCTDDELIWRSKNSDKALYLRKATVHPDHRGKGLMRSVVEFAVETAEAMGLDFLRLDTWASNDKLVELYQRCGFEHLENYQVPDEDCIPLNTRGNLVALLELRIHRQ